MKSMIQTERMRKMNVDILTEEEIEREKEKIIQAVLPEKQSALEKWKKIYFGPGFRAIFYHCEGSVLVTLFVYPLLFLYGYLAGADMNTKLIMAMVAFPTCFLLFSYLSCFIDEQEEIIDLKKSMHYSVLYLLCLRMFYSSIAMSVINILVFFPILGFDGYALWRIGVLGVSSMFLLAGISIWLYHRWGRSYPIGILFGIWTVFSTGMLYIKNVIVKCLIYGVPLALHLIIAVCLVVGFIIYIRKVEKRDAYTFAY